MGLKRSYAIIIGTICVFGILLQAFLYFQKKPDESDGAPQVTHQLLMSITIDDKPAGDIEIGLFGKAVPKTVKILELYAQGRQERTRMESQDLIKILLFIELFLAL